jgi:hypothetical protein
VLATAAVALAGVELVAFFGLRWVGGSWLGYASLETERVARAAGVVGGAEPEEIAQRRDAAVRRALHPYLGWVQDADDPNHILFGETSPEARELGFPNNPASPLQEADPDRLVVAVLGGSVAADFVRKGADVLAERLVQLPRFRGREPVILSLALPGYKQPQQLMALAYMLALGAHFDLVLNLDGYNELIASVHNYEGKGVFPAYPKRRFERVGDLDAEVRLGLGEIAYVQEIRRERSLFFSLAPLRWSLTAGLVWKLQDRGLESRVAAAQERLGRGDPAERYQARGPRRQFASSEALLEEVAALWGRSSRQMHALTRAHGSEYHHFLQPNQYLPDSKVLTAREREKAFRPGTRRDELIRGGYPLLQREGARLAGEGVHFHDLTGIFDGVEGPIYVDICCHVNKAGNRLIAEAIARALAEPGGA